MIQVEDSGNHSNISYHGTSLAKAKRMNVIVNGISEYRPSLAEATWTAIPIAIDDIKYVEVVRSPSSSSYGSNSMMAVVHIETKTAENGINGLVVYGKSTGSDYYSAGVQAFLPENGTLMSLSRDYEAGYDTNDKGENRRDDLDGKTFNVRYTTNQEQVDLDLFFGARKSLAELEQRDAGQQTYPDEISDVIQMSMRTDFHLSKNNDLRVSFYAHQLEQEFDWRTCYPTIFFSENLRALNNEDPTYVRTLLAGGFPTGGSAQADQLRNVVLGEYAALGASATAPICGDVNEDGVERKQSLTIENIYVFDDLRFIGGFEVLNNYLNHNTFISDKSDAATYMGFGHVEYLIDDFVLNVGALVEDEDGLKGNAISPRAALNYRINNEKTLRFSVSKALRTTDIMENERDWNYYMVNMTPAYPDGSGRTSGYFYYRSASEGRLDSEEIISREISLYSESRVRLLNTPTTRTYDVKFFHDSMKNLISEKPQFFDFNLTNNGFVKLQGFEFENAVEFFINNDFLESLKLRATYAYIDNDTNSPMEQSLHAQHSGSAYSIFNFHDGYLATLSYWGNSEIYQETTDAYFLGFGRIFKIDQNKTLSLLSRIGYEPDIENHVFQGTLKSAQVDIREGVLNINDHRTTVQFSAELAL